MFALRQLATRGAVRGVKTRAAGASLRSLLSNHVELLAKQYDILERENMSSFCGQRAQRMAKLAPALESRERIRKGSTDLEELRELAADDEAEVELREMAQSELEELEELLEQQHQELLAQITPEEVCTCRAGVACVLCLFDVPLIRTGRRALQERAD